MKLAAVTMFGIGYVLGSKAGRERYEQICKLARDASNRFDTSGLRKRLEAYASRLEAYSSQAPSHRTPPG